MAESLRSENQDLSFRDLTAIAERKRKFLDRGIALTPDGEFNNLALMMSDQCPWRTEIRTLDGTVDVIGGAVPQQVASAVRRVREAREDLANKERMSVSPIPDLALNEAVLNAACHRSYCSMEPTVVHVTSAAVAITSPGG